MTKGTRRDHLCRLEMLCLLVMVTAWGTFVVVMYAISVTRGGEAGGGGGPL